jgi:hypothetical protein
LGKRGRDREMMKERRKEEEEQRGLTIATYNPSKTARPASLLDPSL